MCLSDESLGVKSAIDIKFLTFDINLHFFYFELL